ncbi:hypothetical protein HDU67_006998 [Dinochytrium kinnereticum]|nr:hypothetical protein HDU67_006998 [Dinochytrium kinnereticum]
MQLINSTLIVLFAFFGLAIAQGTTTSGVTTTSVRPTTTAGAPAAGASTFVIVQPLTNANVAAGASLRVTWTFTGFAPDTTVSLRLQDIRRGETTGTVFSTFEGSFRVSDLQATVTIPANAPAGTFAISAILGGNVANYFSSPPITILASGSASASILPITSSRAASSGAAATTTSRSGTVSGTASAVPGTSSTTTSRTGSASKGGKIPFWYNIVPAFVYLLVM